MHIKELLKIKIKKEILNELLEKYHKNDINNNIRYKCLIKGEYVHFKIVNSDKGLKCENITGIDNNMLLCESNSDLLKKLILCQYIEKTNPNLSFIKMS